MSAAQEHLEITATAQAETQTLAGMLGGFTALAEATAGAISHAVDELATHVGKSIEQLSTAKASAEQTVTKGNDHVESAANTGHGTAGFAQAALEQSEEANNKLAGLQEMLEGMVAAIGEAKSTAVTAIMGASAPTEEITEGVKNADERLGEAIGNINAAIHS